MTLLLAETAAHVVPPLAVPSTDPNAIAAQVWAIPSVPLHIAILTAAVLAGVWWAAQKVWGANKGIALYLTDWHRHRDAVIPHVEILKGDEFSVLLDAKLVAFTKSDAFQKPVRDLIEHVVSNQEQKFLNQIRDIIDSAVSQRFATLDKKFDAMQASFDSLQKRVDASIDRHA